MSNHLLIYVATHKSFSVGVFTQPVVKVNINKLWNLGNKISVHMSKKHVIEDII